MTKDWTGNGISFITTNGFANNRKHDRETADYYATEPKALKLLLDIETFSKNIWECACGEGHLSKVLIDAGYNVRSSDLIDRGYSKEILDFIAIDNNKVWGGGYNHESTLQIRKRVY